MSRYFDEMSGVIERHGGSVEKFIGDAVMAVFGIPRLHEDDALRAVRAARDMRDALRELNAELEQDHGVGLDVRIRGRCLSYGDGIAFFPLAEVVQEAAGVEGTDDVATGWSNLAALAEGVEDRDRIVALVAGLLSWAEPVSAEEAYWGVRKLFEHLARRGPLVVLFDDIHWAEPAFLDLIECLADWTRDAPLLLVCVARPERLELRTGWAGGKLNATTILLEALPGDEVSRLVDNLLVRADIPSTARARILDAAEGNPLFVEQILGMLIDDGLLRFDDGRWRAVEDLVNVTVPPTIQLLIAARLDRLDTKERAVIERGAVEGKVFHVGAVTRLAPEELRPQVRSRLLALARKELIRSDPGDFAGEDAFRFRHLLIRDAAYQALPKAQRAELHERFAAWLEHAAGRAARRVRRNPGLPSGAGLPIPSQAGRAERSHETTGPNRRDAADRLGRPSSGARELRKRSATPDRRDGGIGRQSSITRTLRARGHALGDESLPGERGGRAAGD
jgi:AAA ATPase domain